MTSFKLSSINKKLILLLSDAVIIVISITAAFSLRLETIYPFWDINFLIYLIYGFTFFTVFSIFNIYQILIRFFDNFSILKIVKAIILIQLILIIINLIAYKFIYFPRSISFIAPVLIGIFSIVYRVFINYYINSSKKNSISKNNILIYGVNDDTVSLLKNLRLFPSYGNVKAFIDVNNKYRKRELNGIKIFKKDDLNILLDKFNITEVITYKNPVNSIDSKKTFSYLENKNIRIRGIKATQNYIHNFMNKFFEPNIDFHDIINRSKVKVKNSILKKKIFNKNILITGGGGSIGSELCLEILNHSPKTLYIIDNSEINLFKIMNKIKNKKLFSNKKVKPILGDFGDTNFLKSYFNKISLHDVYHAAAYKHVNFGETSSYSFFKNNVLATISLLKFLTITKKIKNFVFISSDKAVNPKSILGYTKKLGEIIVGYFYFSFSKTKKINFTIVRFGNVIGSSGSVIPIFLDQIKNSTSLTVRSKNAKRYFMSINEAVQLVINAAYLNKKGIKIYALNMGKQIKIYDIAKRIIFLSGYKLKNKKNPDGDISIKIVGLKKGEKVAEEVSLGKKLIPTDHSKINLCEDPVFNKDLNKTLDENFKRLKLKEINFKTFNNYLENNEKNNYSF
tara:strand:- start:3808 stop:5676 length:1869 start_codon:yes stop_codon:yes gene_type:complete